MLGKSRTSKCSHLHRVRGKISLPLMEHIPRFQSDLWCWQWWF